MSVETVNTFKDESMHVIDCLKDRGLIEDMTSPAEIMEHLSVPRRVYCGFDPTADSLHVGNLVPMIVLRWFQKCGHTPVVILGGATGRIGDPSGKSTERPLLDSATIAYNVARIRRNFEGVLDFFHTSARAIVLNNDEWFSKFSCIDFLRDIGKQFRLGAMLSKESVRSRLHSDEGMSFTEFTYQILQSYDFYHLYKDHKVTVQIGGSDQWGNITEGVDLVRKMASVQAFGVTMPLLTRSDGKKFGKSEQGAIWLSADKCSEYEFYQYFVRMPDADVIRMMRLLTFMDLKEIQEIEQQMTTSSYVPNTAQKRLAEEMTRLIHGEEGVAKAVQITETASPGADVVLNPEVLARLSQEIPSVVMSMEDIQGQKFVDVVVKAKFLPSKSEAVRLIHNGGAYLNNTRVSDEQLRLASSDLIGHEFLLIGSGKKKKMVIQVGKK